jgi:hypothetical protein
MAPRSMLSQPVGKAMGRPVRFARGAGCVSPSHVCTVTLRVRVRVCAHAAHCDAVRCAYTCIRQGANVASDDIVARRFMQAERRRAQRR